MGMSVAGGKPRIRPEINVTPLVDVVLVLLIIFMVVMPMMSQKFWLQVPKPPDETAQPAPPDPNAKPPPVLYVDSGGGVTLNSERLADPDLARRIERAAAATPDGTVFFDAADDADYARAIEVMDRAKAAGANVAILPKGLRAEIEAAQTGAAPAPGP